MKTHLLIPCTSRKRIPAEPALRLGRADDTPWGSPLAEYVASWTDRIDASKEEPLPASELYKGEQWAAVRNLVRDRPDVSVWVCSAGYGLIGYQTLLKSYSATFTVGEPDSVHRVIERSSDADRTTEWWSQIANWNGPASHGPRRISHLVQAEPKSRFVVALSQSYIDACSADLAEAALSAHRDRLIIVSSGEIPDSISQLRVPAPGALRNQLGGTVGTVAVRLAILLISTGETSGGLARGRAMRLSRLAGTLPRYERKRDPTGAEISDYIRRQINRDSGVSASALLRRYRDAGGACEQHRFQRIYREVMEGASHG